MKSIFISYNQAYGEEIVAVLDKYRQRGFTRWEDVGGRGGFNGEPHYGSHAWPVMNVAILTVVPDQKVQDILAELKSMDEATPEMGLRAFVWNIETFI